MLVLSTQDNMERQLSNLLFGESRILMMVHRNNFQVTFGYFYHCYCLTSTLLRAHVSQASCFGMLLSVAEHVIFFLPFIYWHLYKTHCFANGRRLWTIQLQILYSCFGKSYIEMFSKAKLKLALRPASRLGYRKTPQGLRICALPFKSLRLVYGVLVWCAFCAFLHISGEVYAF